VSDRHSDLSVLQLNYDGNNILFFRVPLSIKIKYMILDRKSKRIVKQSLISLVEVLASGGQALTQQFELQQQTVVLNLNLNVQSQEVHQVHQCDEVLEEKVRLLERRLREYQELLKYHKNIERRLKLAVQQNDLKTIKQTLSKLD
jgi:hypothetical protein